MLEVQRDGQARALFGREHASGNGGFKRIRIGDPDVFLDYGVHTYTIRYTMTRMAPLLRGPRRALLERHRQLLEFPHPQGHGDAERAATAP